MLEWLRRLIPGGAVRQAREELEAAKLRHEQAATDLRTRMLEGWYGWDGGVWFLGPNGYYAAGGTIPIQTQPPAQPSDRARGQEWPLVVSEEHLLLLVQRSRVLCRTNAYARGALRNLTNYVIGKGYSCTAASLEMLPDADPDAPGHQDPAAIERHVASVQDVLDNFARINRWAQRQRETYRRTKRDGDCFIRLFPQPDGTTLIRFIDPACVRNPPGTTDGDGWSYGIRHQVEPHEDVETILEYYVVAKNGRGGECVDASEIVHIKNTDEDSDVKRGMPEFSWETLDALRRASRLTQFTSEGAAINASTAEVTQHATGTMDQVNQLAAGLRTSQRTDPLTGQVINVEEARPGTRRRIPAGQEFVSVPPPNTAQHQQAAQGDLRQAAAAMNAAEFMVSADASNADYSSTKEAGAPFVRAGESEQEHYREAFHGLLARVLQIAADGGLVDPEALDVVEVQVTPSAVLHHDELQQTQRRQIGVMSGWKSRQTACEEEGGDWEQEQQRILEYNDQMGQSGATLPLPGDGAPAPAPGGPVS